MFDFLKRRRRAILRAAPMSVDREAICARAVHLWPYLSVEDRHEIEGTAQIFVDEKRFEGGADLAITDEIRFTVAAEAGLLLLHRDTDVFPELDTVLVYPRAWTIRAAHREGPVVIEGPETRLGESWQRGLVVLAWDEVKRDVRSRHSGHNVVLHELAHQLDAENGAVDGAPRLGEARRFTAWAEVLGAEYHDLGERLRLGIRSDIDPYAATSPAEFFAVVTEEFFERADVLRAKHPALYHELAEFYRLDPAELVARGRR